MTTVKWAGVLTATLSGALVAMANTLLAALTPYTVPPVVNEAGIGLVSTSTVLAFGAHALELADRKLDLLTDLVVMRLESLERRVGDYNNGFVDGYQHRLDPEVAVVPALTQDPGRGASRRPRD